MPGFMRKFGKGIFVAANFFLSGLFFLSSYNDSFDPDRWWYIALLGLGLPLLIIVQLIFFVSWLLLRSRWAVLPLFSIIVCLPAIRMVIAFNLPRSFQVQKDSSTLRVLSWNVSWFDAQSNNKRKPALYRNVMLDYIREQKADVLCFQEYLEPGSQGLADAHSAVFKKMGYPYFHWVGDYVWRDGRLNAGTAIFSKYPILGKFRWRYPGSWFERAAESLIAVDIDYHGSPIRIFTAHLQSLQFNENDYRALENIARPGETTVRASVSILRKIKIGYKYRVNQARLVREQLDESPYPEILCGDFNDVPGSFAYSMVRGRRRDAFLEKGSGIGRTFHAISPTLRIDYILTHPDFRIVQFRKKEFSFTDHYPIVADIQLSR